MKVIDYIGVFYDHLLAKYKNEIVTRHSTTRQLCGHHVGDAGLTHTGRAVEQDLHRNGGIGAEVAGLGDKAVGDGGGGTAEVIGSGRPPRQRWRCGARCRVGEHLQGS